MNARARSAKQQPAIRTHPLPDDWPTTGALLPHPEDRARPVFVSPATITALLDGRFALPGGVPDHFVAERVAAALVHAGWAHETTPGRVTPSAALLRKSM